MGKHEYTFIFLIALALVGLSYFLGERGLELQLDWIGTLGIAFAACASVRLSELQGEITELRSELQALQTASRN